jgi:dihydrofolate synthase/folylpolyglutamate synthase
VDNAAIAIGIVEQLCAKGSFSVKEEAFLEGVRQVNWPGRIDRIRTDPAIFLDGAHNPAGAQALAAFLTTIDPGRSGRHWLMAGMLRDKNIKEIMAPLIGWADEIAVTRPAVDRAATPAQIAEGIPSSIFRTIYATVPGALDSVTRQMGPRDTLVITGSLYVIGEALAYFKEVTLSPVRG